MMLNSITKKCCRQHVANCCLGVRPPLYWRAKPRNQILKKKEVVGRVAGENEEGRLSSKPILPNIKKKQRKTGGTGSPEGETPSDTDRAIYNVCPIDFEEDVSAFDSDHFRVSYHSSPDPTPSKVFLGFPSITARMW
jgi:hypothetical protein